MYSGLRQFTPWAAASATLTLESSGFSLLKSAKRWVASLKRDTEWPENTYRQNTTHENLAVFLPQDKCSSWPLIHQINRNRGKPNTIYSCILYHHIPVQRGDPSHQSRAQKFCPQFTPALLTCVTSDKLLCLTTCKVKVTKLFPPTLWPFLSYPV